MAIRERSRKYTNVLDQDGVPISGTYSILYNKDGKVKGFVRHDSTNPATGGKEVPLDPGSSEFKRLLSSSTVGNDWNRNNFGGNVLAYKSRVLDENGRDDPTQLSASIEETAQTFNENNAKFNNEEQLELQNNIENSNSPTRAYDSYKRGRNVSTTIHAYPLDIDIQQDHLMITKYKYFRPDEERGKGNDARKANASGPGASGGTGGRILTSGLQIGQVILPMPKIQDTNGAEWGESKLSALGVTIVDAATGLGAGSLGRNKRRTSAIQKEINNRLTRKIRKINDRALRDQRRALQGNRRNRAGLTDIGGQLLADGAVRIAESAGVQLSQNQFLARSSGRVLNPNAELLFGGPVLRDFNFDFTLVARSQNEGKEIRKIIRFFKTGMMAKFLGTSAFLATPDIFTLEYKRGTRLLNTVNRFNETGLALRTMAVDYAPNGFWSAYRDSQPTSLKISLNFAELKPIYDEDQINSPEDSVGF
tara:strand:+ start:817 stop:2250 length:1434 start_codon:yes stop_codon:yes gene_type:complete